ncbi:hypothetical protein KCU78_g7475, partial [Aureobasidium melanogenum]
MKFSSSLSSNLLLSIHNKPASAGLMPYISMEAKTDEQATKATLDKKRPTPIIARAVPFPERLGEEFRVPARDPFVTKSFKSPSQSFDQLRARQQAEEKIEHLNEMSQICQNALTLLMQQKKMSSRQAHL